MNRVGWMIFDAGKNYKNHVERHDSCAFWI